jgi:Raf kinase inhibitor-like YbhB/YbcL family protein
MGRRYARVVARWWIFLLLVIAGCGGGDEPSEPAPKAPPGIELTSSAFDAGAAIPKRYSCDGDEISPPLQWADVPNGAKSLALLMEDPDAPSGTFVHWTVFDIPPTAREFDQGKTPAGSHQGENSFGKTGYGGPCPPKGDKAHRYVFSLYALRAELSLEAGAKPDEVSAAVDKQAIARGEIIGTFKRG